MSGKRRTQRVLLDVCQGRIDFLPIGAYSVYIDGAEMRKGQVHFTGRVLDSLANEEKREEVRESG